MQRSNYSVPKWLLLVSILNRVVWPTTPPPFVCVGLLFPFSTLFFPLPGALLNDCNCSLVGGRLLYICIVPVFRMECFRHTIGLAIGDGVAKDLAAQLHIRTVFWVIFLRWIAWWKCILIRCEQCSWIFLPDSVRQETLDCVMCQFGGQIKNSMK